MSVLSTTFNGTTGLEAQHVADLIAGHANRHPAVYRTPFSDRDNIDNMSSLDTHLFQSLFMSLQVAPQFGSRGELFDDVNERVVDIVLACDIGNAQFSTLQNILNRNARRTR